MRVLHIFNEINFSGAEIMYANAAPLFQKDGFELFAVSTGETPGNFVEQFKSVNIKIFHKPFKAKSKNPFYLWNYLKGIILFIKNNDIDIIHIHRSNVFWYFALCGYMAKKKTLMTLHNVFKARKISWIKHYLTRLTARVLFNLTFQSIGKSVYENELNYFKNPTVRINNWFDSTRFFPPVDYNEKRKLREKLDIGMNSFVIISTGSCTDIKNHKDIINALSIIEKKQLDFVYLHLGTGCLENYEMQLAEELGIKRNIIFLGNKVNVRDYLIASDLFIMTSRFEGLSIASIEAMACKLPSILYNSPGLRDLIENDDNGLLIEPDYKLLAASILKFYNDPQIGIKKGENSVKYVTKNHQMATCVTKIINLYRIND